MSLAGVIDCHSWSTLKKKSLLLIFELAKVTQCVAELGLVVYSLMRAQTSAVTFPRSPSWTVVRAVLEFTFLTVGPFFWVHRGLNKTQPGTKDVAHNPDLGPWALKQPLALSILTE